MNTPQHLSSKYPSKTTRAQKEAQRGKHCDSVSVIGGTARPVLERSKVWDEFSFYT